MRLLSLKRQPASGFHRSRVRQEPREYHFTATTRPVDVSGSEQLLLDVRKTGAGPYRLPSSKLPTGIRPAGAQKHLKSTWQLPLRCVRVCVSSTKRTRARRVEHEEDYRLDMHVDRYVGQVQGPRKKVDQKPRSRPSTDADRSQPGGLAVRCAPRIGQLGRNPYR